MPQEKAYRRGGRRRNPAARKRGGDLGSSGMSVFRLPQNERFDETLAVLHENLGRYVLSQRGIMQKPPAVNLVEMAEVKWQSVISSVLVQDAIDAVYQSVPSVRRRCTVSPSGVDIFGRRDSTARSVGVVFSHESCEPLVEERANVVDVLEAFSCQGSEAFKWQHRKVPHISLLKIATSTPDQIIDRAIEAATLTLPADMILSRAILHNPHN